MKVKELREMDVKQLNEKLADLKKELFNLQIGRAHV